LTSRVDNSSEAKWRNVSACAQQLSTGRFGLILVLILALAVRLATIDFGLPDFVDPDEPLFLLLAARMIQHGTLNPHWFGHPGTITLYGIAAIELIVMAATALSGGIPPGGASPQFVVDHATTLMLAERSLIVAFGVLTVFLTDRLGRRIGGRAIGILSALLLALNPLHIRLSQIVRTDIEATAFMLGCLIFCVRIAQTGRRRDYVAAGICVAAACVTKWPAAVIGTGIIGAFLVAVADPAADRSRQVGNLVVAGISALIAMMVLSPFIFLDYHTVASDLGVEAQTSHLDATGGGPLHNFLWYFSNPVAWSFSIAGLAIGLFGAGISLRNPIARNVLIVPAVIFIVALSTQHLIWDRWIVPILPVFAVFIAVGIERIWRIAGRSGPRAGMAAAAASIGLVLVPMTAHSTAQAIEMRNDTRLEAADWMHHNVPAGSTVLYEYFAVHALNEPWRVLYPAAKLGCIDVRASFSGGTSLDDIKAFRGTRSIVDIGTIAPSQLSKCRADYAVLTDYDRYLTAGTAFASQLDIYRHLIRHGREVAAFRPIPGRRGGPVVHVVRLTDGPGGYKPGSGAGIDTLSGVRHRSDKSGG